MVNGALKLLGDHLGLFTVKVDLTSGGDKLVVDVFQTLLERARGAVPAE